eukprot:SAG11_NODE_11350_length_766_cov_1.569715_1_plen_187_part_01
MGPAGVKTLAEFIPTTPGVVEVNLCQNTMISANDLITVQTAAPRLSVIFRGNLKLLLDKEQVQKLDVSNCGLGPGEISFLATDTIPTTLGLVEVVISGNKCFGSKTSTSSTSFINIINKGRSSRAMVHDTDKDQSGWNALCKAMHGSNVQTLGFADIGMGPVGMKTLAETIPTIPGLVEVVISDNKC